MIIIFHEGDIEIIKACYKIGFITQVLFFGIEMIRMYKLNFNMKLGFKNYLKSLNVIDLSSFLNYFVQMCIHIWYPDSTENMLMILLIIALVLQVFIKVLFFMRINAKFGFLIQMLKLTVVDMGPFLFFFMIFSIFYTIENRVLKVQFDENEYEGINRFS